MRYQRKLPLACITVLSCSLLFAEATENSIPQPNVDRYATEEFGNCTFGFGKDSDRYITPFVSCTSGDDRFALFGKDDGAWGVLLSPTYETDRADVEENGPFVNVTFAVDDNNAHQFSMWATEWNVVVGSIDASEITPLLDELREGRTMTITRKAEAIEFDLERANQAFSDLLVEQLIALSKVETDDEK